ncbi:MAG: hypothetical protein ACRDI0_07335 [Actinomycetota bacterium]
MTWRRLGALIVAAALLAGACGGDGADEPQPSPQAFEEAEQLVVAAQGLCRTLELVEAGELEEAREVFFNRSHDFLHLIAAKGRGAVPRETGLLLEAKQKVEQGLDNPGEPSAVLPQSVFDVHAALSDLAPQLGFTRPEPCPEAAS